MTQYVGDSIVFVIPAIIMYLVLIIVSPNFSSIINLLILIAIGIIIYFASLIILLLVTKQDAKFKKFIVGFKGRKNR